VDENFAGVTLDAVADLPVDRPVSLLMRHSVRAQILENKDVYRADLTPAGAAIACEFGCQIASIRKVGRILSSPVSRCVNTAVLIAEGAGWDHLIEINDWLSHPFMLPVWNAIPASFKGERAPFQVSALLSLLVEGHSRAANVDLFITHDTVIEALAGYASGTELKNNGNVPNYLEALLVWVEGGDICLSWRNKRYKLPVGQSFDCPSQDCPI
jgi:hypothetical protein